MRGTLAAVAAAALAITLAGCTERPSSPAREHGTPAIVASTDVWGSVASAVAGGHATVTSIFSGAAGDPHSFQTSPADAAAIADASLVVFNGGGYDRWIEDVLANNTAVPTVDAYSLLPETQQRANEHVFYDPATAKAVATRIADQIAMAHTGYADDYRTNATEFGKQADEILRIAHEIGQRHPEAAVVATEPVAHYLIANAGITNKTPEGFTDAIEQDTDPAPADLAAMLDLINAHQVSALLYNPQTETAVTKQIRDAATRAAVPIVTVTETLPDGTDYLTWQRQTAQQLASRLDEAARANR